MKQLIETILKYLHLLILGWFAYNVYGDYTEFESTKSSEESKIPVLRTQIKKKQSQIDIAREFENDVEASKKRIELVASQIESVQKQLPNKISDPEILGYFSKEADLINMQEVFLTPLSEENKGFFFSKKYKLKAKGTYLQILVFFDRISRGERLYNVSFLDIKESDEKQRGRFKIIEFESQLEAFRFNPAHKEERGLDVIETQYGNRAKAKKPKPKRKKKK